MNTRNSRRNSTKRNLSSLLLAAYVFSCMFIHLFGHGISAENSRELYMKLSQERPDEPELLVYFEWAIESKFGPEDGMRWGVSLGFVVGVSTFVITRYSLKRKAVSPQRRSFEVPMLLILLIYLLTFLAVAFYLNPFFIRNPIDPLMAFTFGGLGTWIGLGFAGRIRMKNRRMDFTLDRGFQMVRLELEHERLKELIHLFVWAGLSGMVGIGFVLVYQSYYATPELISRTALYRLSLTCTFLYLMLAFMGYWLGIVAPVHREMEDIVGIVRRYEVWLKRREKRMQAAHATLAQKGER